MPAISPEIKRKMIAPEAEAREDAARALGRIPGHESLGYLKEMLSDNSPDVVRATVRSLAGMGGREAVEEIIPLLRSEDARLRNLGVEILTGIGSDALPHVAALVSDPDRDVRKFAVDILKAMRTPDAEDTLIRALYDEDDAVATAAAEALGAVGTQRAAPHLADCLDKAPWLKYAVLKSLGEIGGEAALKAVLTTGLDEESVVLFHAVTALGAIGDSRGLDFVCRILETPRPSLAPAAVGAAARMLRHADAHTVERAKASIPAPLLMDLLKRDRTDDVRSTVDLLGLFGVQAAVPELTRLYCAANEALLDALEQALLKIAPDSIAPIVGILEDPMQPASVTASAVRLLGRLGHADGVDALAGRLEGAPPTLKAGIARALGEIGDRRALPALHGLLKSGDAEVKIAAADALAALRETASVPFLMRLAADASEPVRSAAAAGLRTFDLASREADLRGLLQAARVESVAFGLDAIPDALLPAFRETVLDLCRHGDAGGRRRAVARCAAFDDDAAFEAVADALADPAPEVRLAGIRGMATCAGRNVGGLLFNAATADADAWNGYEAVQAIGRLRLHDMLPDLVDLLAGPAPDLVKTAALDVLGELGGDEYTALLEAYTQTGNDALKEAAADALERIERGLQLDRGGP